MFILIYSSCESLPKYNANLLYSLQQYKQKAADVEALHKMLIKLESGPSHLIGDVHLLLLIGN